MPLRLLIAEDSATNRLLLSMTMARIGIDADIAANGKEALALFHQHRYDLVFLDLEMPALMSVRPYAAPSRDLRSIPWAASSSPDRP
jgi:CheY-like chemotaxis protein